MITISSTARQQAIFRWLWNPEGVLHRYRVPDHLSDDAIRAEVGDLVYDLDDALPGSLDADAVADLLPAVRRALRRRHAGHGWPTARTFIEAAQETAQAATRAHGGVDAEERLLEGLVSFYRHHGEPLAGVATALRTAALIRRGILTAREARHAGFPLTAHDDAEARRQLPCWAEVETAIRCRARLQDGEITEADARDALTRLDPRWDELFPAEQARIVALVVERIDMSTEGMDVRLRTNGMAALAHEMITDVGAAA